MQLPCKRDSLRCSNKEKEGGVGAHLQAARKTNDGGWLLAQQIRAATAAVESLLLLPPDVRSPPLKSPASFQAPSLTKFVVSRAVDSSATATSSDAAFSSIGSHAANAEPFLNLLEVLQPFASVLGAQLLLCLNHSTDSTGKFSTGSSNSSSSKVTSGSSSRDVLGLNVDPDNHGRNYEDHASLCNVGGHPQATINTVEGPPQKSWRGADKKTVSVAPYEREELVAAKNTSEAAVAAEVFGCEGNQLHDLLHTYTSVSCQAEELVSLFQVLLLLWPASDVAKSAAAKGQAEKRRGGGASQLHTDTFSIHGRDTMTTDISKSATELVSKLEILAEIVVLLLCYLVAAPVACCAKHGLRCTSPFDLPTGTSSHANSLPQGGCIIRGGISYITRRAIASAITHPIRLHAFATFLAASRPSAVAAESSSVTNFCRRKPTSLGTAAVAVLRRSPHVRLACWKLLCATVAADTVAAVRIAAALNSSSRTTSAIVTQQKKGPFTTKGTGASEDGSAAEAPPSPLWEATAAAVQGPQQKLLQQQSLRQLRDSGIWDNPWPPSTFASNIAVEDTAATAALLRASLYHTTKRCDPLHVASSQSVCSERECLSESTREAEKFLWKKTKGYMRGDWSVAWGRTFARCCCLSRCCSPVISSLLLRKQPVNVQGRQLFMELQQQDCTTNSLKCMSSATLKHGLFPASDICSEGTGGASVAAAIVCGVVGSAAAAYSTYACVEMVPQRYALRQQVLQLLLLLLLHPNKSVGRVFLQQPRRRGPAVRTADISSQGGRPSSSRVSNGTGAEMLLLASFPLRFDRRLDALVWLVGLREALLSVDLLQHQQQYQGLWSSFAEPSRVEYGKGECEMSATADNKLDALAAENTTTTAAGAQQKEVPAGQTDVRPEDTAYAHVDTTANAEDICVTVDDTEVDSITIGSLAKGPVEGRVWVRELFPSCFSCCAAPRKNFATTSMLPSRSSGTLAAAAKTRLWRRLSSRRGLLRGYAQLLHAFTARERVQPMLEVLLQRVQKHFGQSTKWQPKETPQMSDCQGRVKKQQQHQQEEEHEKHVQRMISQHSKHQPQAKQEQKTEQRPAELPLVSVSAAWLLHDLLNEWTTVAFDVPLPASALSGEDECKAARQRIQQKHQQLLQLEFLLQLRPVFLPPQQELLLSVVRRTPLYGETQQQLMQHLSASMHLAPRQSTEFALSQLLLARLTKLLPPDATAALLTYASMISRLPYSASTATLATPDLVTANAGALGPLDLTQTSPATAAAEAKLCASCYGTSIEAPLEIPIEGLPRRRFFCSEGEFLLCDSAPLTLRPTLTPASLLPEQFSTVAACQQQQLLEQFQLQEEAEKCGSCLIPSNFHLRQSLTEALLHNSPAINMLGLLLLRSCCHRLLLATITLQTTVGEHAAVGTSYAAGAVKELLFMLCAAVRDRLPDQKTLLNCLSKLQQRGFFLFPHHSFRVTTQKENVNVNYRSAVLDSTANCSFGATCSFDDASPHESVTSSSASAFASMWPVDEVLLRNARAGARSHTARQRKQKKEAEAAVAVEEEDIPDIHIEGLDEDEEDERVWKGSTGEFDTVGEAGGQADRTSQQHTEGSARVTGETYTLYGGNICVEDVLRVGILLVACCCNGTTNTNQRHYGRDAADEYCSNDWDTSKNTYWTAASSNSSTISTSSSKINSSFTCNYGNFQWDDTKQAISCDKASGFVALLLIARGLMHGCHHEHDSKNKYAVDWGSFATSSHAEVPPVTLSLTPAVEKGRIELEGLLLFITFVDVARLYQTLLLPSAGQKGFTFDWTKLLCIVGAGLTSDIRRRPSVSSVLGASTLRLDSLAKGGGGGLRRRGREIVKVPQQLCCSSPLAAAAVIDLAIQAAGGANAIAESLEAGVLLSRPKQLLLAHLLVQWGRNYFAPNTTSSSFLAERLLQLISRTLQAPALFSQGNVDELSVWLACMLRSRCFRCCVLYMVALIKYAVERPLLLLRGFHLLRLQLEQQGNNRQQESQQQPHKQHDEKHWHRGLQGKHEGKNAQWLKEQRLLNIKQPSPEKLFQPSLFVLAVVSHVSLTPLCNDGNPLFVDIPMWGAASTATVAGPCCWTAISNAAPSPSTIHIEEQEEEENKCANNKSEQTGSALHGSSTSKSSSSSNSSSSSSNSSSSSSNSSSSSSSSNSSSSSSSSNSSSSSSSNSSSRGMADGVFSGCCKLRGRSSGLQQQLCGESINAWITESLACLAWMQPSLAASLLQMLKAYGQWRLIGCARAPTPSTKSADSPTTSNTAFTSSNQVSTETTTSITETGGRSCEARNDNSTYSKTTLVERSHSGEITCSAMADDGDAACISDATKDRRMRHSSTSQSPPPSASPYCLDSGRKKITPNGLRMEREGNGTGGTLENNSTTAGDCEVALYGASSASADAADDVATFSATERSGKAVWPIAGHTLKSDVTVMCSASASSGSSRRAVATSVGLSAKAQKNRRRLLRFLRVVVRAAKQEEQVRQQLQQVLQQQGGPPLLHRVEERDLDGCISRVAEHSKILNEDRHAQDQEIDVQGSVTHTATTVKRNVLLPLVSSSKSSTDALLRLLERLHRIKPVPDSTGLTLNDNAARNSCLPAVKDTAAERWEQLQHPIQLLTVLLQRVQPSQSVLQMLPAEEEEHRDQQQIMSQQEVERIGQPQQDERRQKQTEQPLQGLFVKHSSSPCHSEKHWFFTTPPVARAAFLNIIVLIERLTEQLEMQVHKQQHIHMQQRNREQQQHELHRETMHMPQNHLQQQHMQQQQWQRHVRQMHVTQHSLQEQQLSPQHQQQGQQHVEQQGAEKPESVSAKDSVINSTETTGIMDAIFLTLRTLSACSLLLERICPLSGDVLPKQASPFSSSCGNPFACGGRLMDRILYLALSPAFTVLLTVESSLYFAAAEYPAVKCDCSEDNTLDNSTTKRKSHGSTLCSTSKHTGSLEKEVVAESVATHSLNTAAAAWGPLAAGTMQTTREHGFGGLSEKQDKCSDIDAGARKAETPSDEYATTLSVNTLVRRETQSVAGAAATVATGQYGSQRPNNADAAVLFQEQLRIVCLFHVTRLLRLAGRLYSVHSVFPSAERIPSKQHCSFCCPPHRSDGQSSLPVSVSTTTSPGAHTSVCISDPNRCNSSSSNSNACAAALASSSLAGNARQTTTLSMFQREAFDCSPARQQLQRSAVRMLSLLLLQVVIPRYSRVAIKEKSSVVHMGMCDIHASSCCCCCRCGYAATRCFATAADESVQPSPAAQLSCAEGPDVWARSILRLSNTNTTAGDSSREEDDVYAAEGSSSGFLGNHLTCPVAASGTCKRVGNWCCRDVNSAHVSCHNTSRSRGKCNACMDHRHSSSINSTTSSCCQYRCRSSLHSNGDGSSSSNSASNCCKGGDNPYVDSHLSSSSNSSYCSCMPMCGRDTKGSAYLREKRGPRQQLLLLCKTAGAPLYGGGLTPLLRSAYEVFSARIHMILRQQHTPPRSVQGGGDHGETKRAGEDSLLASTELCGDLQRLVCGNNTSADTRKSLRSTKANDSNSSRSTNADNAKVTVVNATGRFSSTASPSHKIDDVFIGSRWDFFENVKTRRRAEVEAMTAPQLLRLHKESDWALDLLDIYCDYAYDDKRQHERQKRRHRQQQGGCELMQLSCEALADMPGEEAAHALSLCQLLCEVERAVTTIPQKRTQPEMEHVKQEQQEQLHYEKQKKGLLRSRKKSSNWEPPPYDVLQHVPQSAKWDATRGPSNVSGAGALQTTGMQQTLFCACWKSKTASACCCFCMNCAAAAALHRLRRRQHVFRILSALLLSHKQTRERQQRLLHQREYYLSLQYQQSIISCRSNSDNTISHTVPHSSCCPWGKLHRTRMHEGVEQKHQPECQGPQKLQVPPSHQKDMHPYVHDTDSDRITAALDVWASDAVVDSAVIRQSEILLAQLCVIPLEWLSVLPLTSSVCVSFCKRRRTRTRTRTSSCTCGRSESSHHCTTITPPATEVLMLVLHPHLLPECRRWFISSTAFRSALLQASNAGESVLTDSSAASPTIGAPLLTPTTQGGEAEPTEKAPITIATVAEEDVNTSLVNVAFNWRRIEPRAYVNTAASHMSSECEAQRTTKRKKEGSADGVATRLLHPTMRLALQLLWQETTGEVALWSCLSLRRLVNRIRKTMQRQLQHKQKRKQKGILSEDQQHLQHKKRLDKFVRCCMRDAARWAEDGVLAVFLPAAELSETSAGVETTTRCPCCCAEFSKKKDGCLCEAKDISRTATGLLGNKRACSETTTDNQRKCRELGGTDDGMLLPYRGRSASSHTGCASPAQLAACNQRQLLHGESERGGACLWHPQEHQTVLLRLLLTCAVELCGDSSSIIVSTQTPESAPVSQEEDPIESFLCNHMMAAGHRTSSIHRLSHRCCASRNSCEAPGEVSESSAFSASKKEPACCAASSSSSSLRILQELTGTLENGLVRLVQRNGGARAAFALDSPRLVQEQEVQRLAAVWMAAGLWKAAAADRQQESITADGEDGSSSPPWRPDDTTTRREDKEMLSTKPDTPDSPNAKAIAAPAVIDHSALFGGIAKDAFAAIYCRLWSTAAALCVCSGRSGLRDCRRGHHDDDDEGASAQAFASEEALLPPSPFDRATWLAVGATQEPAAMLLIKMKSLQLQLMKQLQPRQPPKTFACVQVQRRLLAAAKSRGVSDTINMKSFSAMLHQLQQYLACAQLLLVSTAQLSHAHSVVGDARSSSSSAASAVLRGTTVRSGDTSTAAAATAAEMTAAETSRKTVQRSMRQLCQCLCISHVPQLAIFCNTLCKSVVASSSPHTKSVGFCVSNTHCCPGFNTSSLMELQKHPLQTAAPAAAAALFVAAWTTLYLPLWRASLAAVTSSGVRRDGQRTRIHADAGCSHHSRGARCNRTEETAPGPVGACDDARDHGQRRRQRSRSSRWKMHRRLCKTFLTSTALQQLATGLATVRAAGATRGRDIAVFLPGTVTHKTAAAVSSSRSSSTTPAYPTKNTSINTRPTTSGSHGSGIASTTHPLLPTVDPSSRVEESPFSSEEDPVLLQTLRQALLPLLRCLAYDILPVYYSPSQTSGEEKSEWCEYGVCTAGEKGQRRSARSSAASYGSYVVVASDRGGNAGKSDQLTVASQETERGEEEEEEDESAEEEEEEQQQPLHALLPRELWQTFCWLLHAYQTSEADMLMRIIFCSDRRCKQTLYEQDYFAFTAPPLRHCEKKEAGNEAAKAERDGRRQQQQQEHHFSLLQCLAADKAWAAHLPCFRKGSPSQRALPLALAAATVCREFLWQQRQRQRQQRSPSREQQAMKKRKRKQHQQQHWQYEQEETQQQWKKQQQFSKACGPSASDPDKNMCDDDCDSDPRERGRPDSPQQRGSSLEHTDISDVDEEVGWNEEASSIITSGTAAASTDDCLHATVVVSPPAAAPGKGGGGSSSGRPSAATAGVVCNNIMTVSCSPPDKWLKLQPDRVQYTLDNFDLCAALDVCLYSSDMAAISIPSTERRLLQRYAKLLLQTRAPASMQQLQQQQHQFEGWQEQVKETPHQATLLSTSPHEAAHEACWLSTLVARMGGAPPANLLVNPVEDAALASLIVVAAFPYSSSSPTAVVFDGPVCRPPPSYFLQPRHLSLPEPATSTTPTGALLGDPDPTTATGRPAMLPYTYKGGGDTLMSGGGDTDCGYDIAYLIPFLFGRLLAACTAVLYKLQHQHRQQPPVITQYGDPLGYVPNPYAVQLRRACRSAHEWVGEQQQKEEEKQRQQHQQHTRKKKRGWCSGQADKVDNTAEEQRRNDKGEEEVTEEQEDEEEERGLLEEEFLTEDIAEASQRVWGFLNAARQLQLRRGMRDEAAQHQQRQQQEHQRQQQQQEERQKDKAGVVEERGNTDGVVFESQKVSSGPSFATPKNGKAVATDTADEPSLSWGAEEEHAFEKEILQWASEEEIDEEGLWLRSFASGGGLQLLLMGLSLVNEELRNLSYAGVALYMELLQLSADASLLQYFAERRLLLQRLEELEQRIISCAQQQQKSKKNHSRTNSTIEDEGSQEDYRNVGFACGRRGKPNTREIVNRLGVKKRTYERLLRQQRMSFAFREVRQLLLLLRSVRDSITVTATPVLPHDYNRTALLQQQQQQQEQLQQQTELESSRSVNRRKKRRRGKKHRDLATSNEEEEDEEEQEGYDVDKVAVEAAEQPTAANTHDSPAAAPPVDATLPALNPLLTSFAATAVPVLLRPEHPLFLLLHDVLLRRPRLSEVLFHPSSATAAAPYLPGGVGSMHVTAESSVVGDSFTAAPGMLFGLKAATLGTSLETGLSSTAVMQAAALPTAAALSPSLFGDFLLSPTSSTVPQQHGFLFTCLIRAASAAATIPVAMYANTEATIATGPSEAAVLIGGNSRPHDEKNSVTQPSKDMQSKMMQNSVSIFEQHSSSSASIGGRGAAVSLLLPPPSLMLAAAVPALSAVGSYGELSFSGCVLAMLAAALRVPASAGGGLAYAVSLTAAAAGYATPPAASGHAIPLCGELQFLSRLSAHCILTQRPHVMLHWMERYIVGVLFPSVQVSPHLQGSSTSGRMFQHPAGELLAPLFDYFVHRLQPTLPLVLSTAPLVKGRGLQVQQLFTAAPARQTAESTQQQLKQKRHARAAALAVTQVLGILIAACGSASTMPSLPVPEFPFPLSPCLLTQNTTFFSIAASAFVCTAQSDSIAAPQIAGVALQQDATNVSVVRRLTHLLLQQLESHLEVVKSKGEQRMQQHLLHRSLGPFMGTPATNETNTVIGQKTTQCSYQSLLLLEQIAGWPLKRPPAQVQDAFERAKSNEAGGVGTGGGSSTDTKPSSRGGFDAILQVVSLLHLIVRVWAAVGTAYDLFQEWQALPCGQQQHPLICSLCEQQQVLGQLLWASTHAFSVLWYCCMWGCSLVTKIAKRCALFRQKRVAKGSLAEPESVAASNELNGDTAVSVPCESLDSFFSLFPLARRAAATCCIDVLTLCEATAAAATRLRGQSAMNAYVPGCKAAGKYCGDTDVRQHVLQVLAAGRCSASPDRAAAARIKEEVLLQLLQVWGFCQVDCSNEGPRETSAVPVGVVLRPPSLSPAEVLTYLCASYVVASRRD